MKLMPIFLLSFVNIVLNFVNTPVESFSVRSTRKNNRLSRSRTSDDDIAIPRPCEHCNCSKCPARCDDCPKCDAFMLSLTDFRQATTKMVTKESQVVADVAPDIPDNETFPQIDSLVHKLDDIMKSINTICLKDYRNLMKYRKEIKRGNPISNFRNDDPISSTLISISTLTSGAYLETLANSIPGTLHDRYTSSLQNMASNSISGAQLSSSLPYQVSRFLPNRPRRALRTRTSTHRMRQMSNSSESGPDDESQFTNSYSTTPPFSSVQTTRISKNTRENVPVKTPSFPPQALLTSSAPSGPINPPKHDATNRCIETLIEFAGFTKDFRIWYMERLRRASSAVLRSLALQA